MEVNKLSILTLKLKRLSIKHEIINNDSIIIKGAYFSKGNIIYMIILPIIFLLLFLVLLGILILTPEIDRIRFPRIILILPIILVFIGIKNFLRLKKGRKQSVCIKKGIIELIDKKGLQTTIIREDIKSINLKIEENEMSSNGEIFVINAKEKSYLLLSVLNNNDKLLKDDLEYIKRVFKDVVLAK